MSMPMPAELLRFNPRGKRHGRGHWGTKAGIYALVCPPRGGRVRAMMPRASHMDSHAESRSRGGPLAKPHAQNAEVLHRCLSERHSREAEFAIAGPPRRWWEASTAT